MRPHPPILFFPVLLSMFCAAALVRAEVPSAFHYQGRIIVDGVNFTGTGQFKFLLYAHTDSDAVPPAQIDLPLWSNVSTVPADLGEPAAAVSLPVAGGLYTVGLGDASLAGMAPLPDSIIPALPHDQVFLRVWFNDGGAGGFTQLAPDQPVRAVPFARHAGRAEAVAAGSIGSAALAPQAVTAGKIEPGAVSQLGSPGGSIPDAVQVDALGHAGVGTANPQAALHVSGGADVTAPVVLSALPPTGLSFMASNGQGLLAVADGMGGSVSLWDISDPASPLLRETLVNGHTTNGHLYDTIPHPVDLAFAPGGTLLAVISQDPSGFNQWITLISVDTAAAPNAQFQAFIQDDTDGFDDLDEISALAFTETEAGRLLAVASRFTSNAISFIDASAPSSPQLQAVIRDGDGFERLDYVQDLAFEGALLAAASPSENAVTLIDATDPGSPQLLSVLEQGVDTAGHTYEGLSHPVDVELRGALLAVVSDRSGLVGEEQDLTLVSVEDPASPQHRLTLLPSSGEVPYLGPYVSLALGADDLLGVACDALNGDAFGASVAILDASDPGDPVLLCQFREGQGEFGNLMWPDIAFEGGHLLVNGAGSGGVIIVDPFVSMPGAAGLVTEERVGIGLSAPEAALHVAGDVRVDNASLFNVHAARVALGIGNSFLSSSGMALGNSNSVGYSGMSFGAYNQATGPNSFAIGGNCVASASDSLAAGFSATASDQHAVAVGSYARAEGKSSLALGHYASATGEEAAAVGSRATAAAEGAFAAGRYSMAAGPESLALGAFTHAEGSSSTALGHFSLAGGSAAMAMGLGTTAPSYAETALGAYNTTPATVHSSWNWHPQDRLFVIGNGTSPSARSDLLTIYKDGRLTHTGSMTTVGDMTTVANFKYQFPRARRYQIPAAAFDPSDRETDFLRVDGHIHYRFQGATTTGVFKAPVHLPHGATITKLTVYYFDNFEVTGGDGSTVYITSIQGDLRRMGNGADDCESELVAATLSAGTFGFPLESVKYAVDSASVAQPVVDNDSYQYWVEVDFSVNQASSALRFYGATIDYTQDTVAP